MELTPACYASLLHMLQGVTTQVCAVLEGGYCLPALAHAAALSLRALLGPAPPVTPAPRPALSYYPVRCWSQQSNIRKSFIFQNSRNNSKLHLRTEKVLELFQLPAYVFDHGATQRVRWRERETSGHREVGGRRD